MANQDRKAGLIPVKHSAGGTVRGNAYHIASGESTDIHRGDLVKSTGTGKGITKAGATDTAVGVFAGCYFTDASGDVHFEDQWAGGTQLSGDTKAEAHVYDDPNILFEIQASSDLAEADIGAMASSTSGGGNDTTGISDVELDSSSIAASAKQLKIMDLADRPDNSFGVNAKVYVLISKHELHAARTAV